MPKSLVNKQYYLVDDLTQVDIKEKGRWKPQVQDLYQRGTAFDFLVAFGEKVIAGILRLSKSDFSLQVYGAVIGYYNI